MTAAVAGSPMTVTLPSRLPTMVAMASLRTLVAIGSRTPARLGIPKSKVTSNVTSQPSATGSIRQEPRNSSKSPSVCSKTIRRASRWK